MFQCRSDLKRGVNLRSKLIFIGLIISFACILVGQIFGPHSNFIEIQFTIWLIIGLLLAYVKNTNTYLTPISNQNNRLNLRNKLNVLNISNKLNFNLGEKLGAIVIVLIFSALFAISSATTLSINVQQNLLDIKNNFRGWENIYGFYNPDKFEGKPVRWTGIDASEVVDKKGNNIIIPVRDVIPEEYRTPLAVKIFIDNLAVKNVIIEDGEWQYIKIKIPDLTKEKFTITFVSNRSWTPKDVGLNRDTRELGILVGEYSWED